MLSFIRSIWAVLMVFYYYVFVKDYKQVKAAGQLDEAIIFTTVIDVEPITLVTMLGASAIGSQ